jgi:hypothetical protein
MVTVAIKVSFPVGFLNGQAISGMVIEWPLKKLETFENRK